MTQISLDPLNMISAECSVGGHLGRSESLQDVKLYMSCIIRKPAFWICQNEEVAQLRDKHIMS